jgi:hypothetical protein
MGARIFGRAAAGGEALQYVGDGQGDRIAWNRQSQRQIRNYGAFVPRKLNVAQLLYMRW